MLNADNLELISEWIVLMGHEVGPGMLRALPGRLQLVTEWPPSPPRRRCSESRRATRCTSPATHPSTASHSQSASATNRACCARMYAGGRSTVDYERRYSPMDLEGIAVLAALHRMPLAASA